VSPLLKIAITWALFQLEGYLLCCKDLLNIIRRGFAIFSGEILSILLLILSVLLFCLGMERIDYNNLIYKYQSGFLPKHSTVHQLLELYNSILNSLEKKEFSCFVFCDFSKAFVKVWHKCLIHKMNSYGIQGKFIKWFENYLFKRRQKVI
jgi:hypothetical protein